MVDRPGWYPPGQVCFPPELPISFKKVYDLKPVVGVPRDDEVIGIHAVIHAANRVSGAPEMHDPDLHMKLVDHLFSVQMARYRSRYSLITFPCDATYTPPALPSPVSVNLEPVSGAPSDEEMKKVQDAIQMYQELRRFPSLFDAHVNMELSQHLFDLQMARYMRLAGESPPNLVPLATATPEIPDRGEERIPTVIDENARPTNNAGTGSSTTGVQPTSNVDVRELMERSNQLAERFNQLLERSNELVERCARPSEQPDSQTFSDKFNQVLERIAQAMEQSHQPTELPNRLDEQFCQLFERFNQLFEQSAQPAQKANELAQRSNELADRANQLADRLNQSHEHSNQLSEQANTTWEQVKNVLGNINKMLMRIQHAIVRRQYYKLPGLLGQP
ncbi:unnamed protein product [Rhizoctonia solani]|uniref:Laminin domain protein n=1 Tax=Rhizoctonia solani TaxID=456999 RepID=A0A8H3AEL1_9AGAM|nr:unnamed protein product [Rhizoctonia solani]